MILNNKLKELPFLIKKNIIYFCIVYVNLNFMFGLIMWPQMSVWAMLYRMYNRLMNILYFGLVVTRCNCFIQYFDNFISNRTFEQVLLNIGFWFEIMWGLLPLCLHKSVATWRVEIKVRRFKSKTEWEVIF